MVDRPAVALLIAALLVGGMACKKPPPPPPDESAKPKDHLAEREFAEGTEKAFALVLPRDSQVVYRITGVVEVQSRLLPEELSNYVRARVAKTTKVFAGADTTTFEDAVLPSEPQRHLQIEIGATRRNTMRSSMTVRDMTPPPPAPKISEEDAYGKAGRRPDGKPLEKHLF